MLPDNYENKPLPLSKTNLLAFFTRFEGSVKKKKRLKQTLTSEVNCTQRDNQTSFLDCKKIFTSSLDLHVLIFNVLNKSSNFISDD